MAVENPHECGFERKTTYINGSCSIAMYDYRRVNHDYPIYIISPLYSPSFVLKSQDLPCNLTDLTCSQDLHSPKDKTWCRLWADAVMAKLPAFETRDMTWLGDRGDGLGMCTQGMAMLFLNGETDDEAWVFEGF